MMMSDTITPYVMFSGSNDALAIVYHTNDQKHEIHYKDKNGNTFFTEKFDMIPIGFVEKIAMEWANGKRELI
jgi:hypothetical protein